ncbi:helix-turn-helix domain-containing protein [Streptococcus anginosus]|uniref:helix-turn-helix domain-containing protein n=1 Tax=Streptococcus anginosus TaxID=1328 RepID=UPI002000BE5A|nr:helix-turn-helix transcriptional regulator [Streptococcus anginosus]MCW1051250.1 helix-turn-helix domain-containing protein [Streptococcus anginosus]
MKKQTLGMMISSLRKAKGMTQLELAEKMGVTDKAVSKWERDLSYPDINTIPKLADLFDTSVDELMQGQTVMKENKKNRKSDIVDTVLRGLRIAMGIVVVVLSALGKVDTKAALTMLGLGLASLSISSLKDKNE